MKKLSILCLIFFMYSTAQSQSDLRILGYFQSYVQGAEFTFDLDAYFPTETGLEKVRLWDFKEQSTASFVQQLNLIATKELAHNLHAWVNFEATRSFSTVNDWGTFALEEAWIRYDYSNALQIKAGQLIPRFNYLNEYKNRTPVLPYIYRPSVYEASLRSVVPIGSFLPERAFLQVYGDLPGGALRFDYAAFIGNSEPAFTPDAQDSTKYNLYGGRFGARYNTLRLGVSATYDKENMYELYNEAVPRTRLGADFGFYWKKLYLEAELIAVNLNAKNTTQDMNKMFYYGTAVYDFSEKFYGHVNYSYIEDKADPFLLTGLDVYVLGGGYRPVFGFTVKLEVGMTQMSGEFDMPLYLDPLNPTEETFLGVVPTEMSHSFKFVALGISVTI
jgi:hypothetical protein